MLYFMFTFVFLVFKKLRQQAKTIVDWVFKTSVLVPNNCSSADDAHADIRCFFQKFAKDTASGTGLWRQTLRCTCSPKTRGNLFNW